LNISRKMQSRRDRLREWLQANLRYFFYKLKYKNPGSPNKELLVDVEAIKLAVNDRWLSRNHPEYKRLPKKINVIIFDDFWDHVEPLTDDYKVRGFHERFVARRAWQDTTLFSYYKVKLMKGVKVQGCNNMDDLVRLYEERHDTLFERLKKEGIKSARGNYHITPIYVYIHQDGSLVYTSGGNHRLAMAKVLGIEKIPVRVRGRHVAWQVIRDELHDLGTVRFLIKYPALAGHPDLF